MKEQIALLVTGLALGCAATTPSNPPPPEETVVVLNAGDATLTLVPVSGGTEQTVPLGTLGGTPRAFTTRGSEALVTTGSGSTVARIDLSQSQSPLLYHLPPAGGAGGAVFVNDTIAYVTNPLSDRVTRFNFKTGDTVSVATGRSPVAVAVARGRVFVVNANLEPVCAGPAPCVRGPSSLTVIDPDHNTVVDSIPLVGPGNAVAIEVGGDGLLYVLSAGAGGGVSGRVSIVDPVLRVEVGSFSGFGELPNDLASDRRERLFITSVTAGLMEFNTRTRRVVRGAGSGIPLISGVAAVVDASGLIYAIESGYCSGGSRGRVRIFRSDLTESRIVTAGICSTAVAIVRLPSSPSE